MAVWARRGPDFLAVKRRSIAQEEVRAGMNFLIGRIDEGRQHPTKRRGPDEVALRSSVKFRYLLQYLTISMHANSST